VQASSPFSPSNKDIAMPVISITLLPGYSKDAEARMVGRVALAARSVIATPAAGTTVFVNHAHTYQRNGKVLNGGAPECVDAAQLVRRFLDHMQERDLGAAARMLTPGFTMRFPGSPVMHRLEEMVERSRGSYKDVAKTYERFDQSWTDDGAVVSCFGTLHGHWLDGSAFEGIRFIDRFEVADDLISRQDVWNDLALHKPTRNVPAS
jgi:hypothetical protein